MAAADLKLNLLATISGSVTGANDIAAPEQSVDVVKRISLALGTLANQADLFFSDSRTIAASGTDSLDLAAGGLTDAFGAALTFAEVVAILVYAHPTNTNNVVVGGAASNAFLGPFADATDKLNVAPGGIAFLVAPTNPAYPVTATTGDILKIANSGGGTGVDYDIIIVGRSS